MATYKEILQSPELSANDRWYMGYQYNLAAETLVPYLTEKGAFREGYSVAEIGSAEGGVLAAFVENGARDALGTDIAQFRLELGKYVADKADLPIEFVSHDIIGQEPEEQWKEKFDLVLLRDVIEHLVDTGAALKNIRKIIKPGGFLFVTFPPYHSPFGGHQHTVMNKWGKIPYIHLLPNGLFQKLISSGRPNDIEEVRRLQKIRLTPEKFRNAALDSGYEIFHSDYYLIRPVFKMKFGLPPLKLTPVSALPLVKSFFSMEAAYLLRAK